MSLTQRVKIAFVYHHMNSRKCLDSAFSAIVAVRFYMEDVHVIGLDLLERQWSSQLGGLHMASKASKLALHLEYQGEKPLYKLFLRRRMKFTHLLHCLETSI